MVLMLDLLVIRRLRSILAGTGTALAAHYAASTSSQSMRAPGVAPPWYMDALVVVVRAEHIARLARDGRDALGVSDVGEVDANPVRGPEKTS